MSVTPQLKYIRLQSDDDLPELSEPGPFKVILIVEEDTSQPWQWDVARWLVRTNCRCVMTWGVECDSWEEAIEDAHLEAFDYDEVPEDKVLITTSHEDEELSEVFWYCRHRTRHPVHDLVHAVIVHISNEAKKTEFEQLYAEA